MPNENRNESNSRSQQNATPAGQKQNPEQKQSQFKNDAPKKSK